MGTVPTASEWDREHVQVTGVLPAEAGHAWSAQPEGSDKGVGFTVGWNRHEAGT